jgi:hypothetical protein
VRGKNKLASALLFQAAGARSIRDLFLPTFLTTIFLTALCVRGIKLPIRRCENQARALPQTGQPIRVGLKYLAKAIST